jgi:segregation and condensation protein A
MAVTLLWFWARTKPNETSGTRHTLRQNQLGPLAETPWGPQMHLTLANFDGPLDLLLHLIKVQEVNVFNIPIQKVTYQFFALIRQLPTLNYAEAGEYLSMAAQLVEIKARMLLPNFSPGPEDAQSLDDISDNDPRKTLVAQLLEQEAAQLRAAAVELGQAASFGETRFASGEATRRGEEWDDLPGPLVGEPLQLLLALERVLIAFAREQAVPTVRVRAQRISIHTRMEQLKEKFAIVPEATFDVLLEDCESRYELIVTLMAVLELCKARQLDFSQEFNYGPIKIFKAERFEDATPGTEGTESQQDAEAQA